MTKLIECKTCHNIMFIALNNPPVNGLNQAVRQGLQEAFRQAHDDERIDAIILMSAISFFCGGADISEFSSGCFNQAPTLPDVLNEIEASKKIVVAAINGAALGGGLELALACDYRFIDKRATLGLPEVHLGLIPGAGGTQRLPRLAGLPLALEMIATGMTISAEKAKAAGLADVLFDSKNEFYNAVLTYTSELVEQRAPVKSCDEISLSSTEYSASIFTDFLLSIDKKAKGLFAPKACVRAVQFACNSSLKDGLAEEQKIFMECMATSQARAQQHSFFAERKAAKIENLNKRITPLPLNSVAIIGAGTMGAGIAMNFINAGIHTTLLDLSAEGIQRGLDSIKTNYHISVQKGRLTQEQVDAALSCLHSTMDYADIAEADLVIEAVFENMEIKQNVFRTLNEVCKPEAILASNTSTLDVNAIARCTNRPERVIGLHFFSPANVMRLLEIVRAERTSETTLLTALQMAKKIRKTPVTVGVCFGFVGNRMLEPYGREAMRLLLEGVRPAQLDAVLTEFGMAMGVCAVSDLAGIDIGYLTRQSRRQQIAHDPTYAVVADMLYERGHYGQKTGRGFYCYEGRVASENEEVVTIAKEAARKFGVQQRLHDNKEILERCLFPLINEAAQILDEGIASRPSDCDVIYVHGYGFPVWRGGPLFYADEIGLNYVVQRLEFYRDTLEEHGRMWFEPAPLLKRLVANRQTFGDLNS
ncbi:Fatty acid oxidation complex subunit alpha [Thalassocella blandensis]|nr:Fatty acid oxidation complex subunit alpha [Thalassocella blandensis]